MLRPLKLAATVGAAKQDPPLANYKSDTCRKCAEAFNENLYRAKSAISAPGLAFALGSMEQSAKEWAELQVSKSGIVYASQDERAKAISEKFQERMALMGRGFAEDEDVFLTVLADDISNYAEFTPKLRSLLEGVVNNVFVSAWTAFEVMAGDLWEGVLNEHPFRLAGLNGKTTRKLRRSKASPCDDLPREDINKQLPMSYLERHKYDLSQLMGTILRAEKVKFTSLEEIRIAYYLAFSNNYVQVDNAINDESLDALSALRNALVHCAGKSDGEFASKFKNFETLKRTCRVDEEGVIVVDGESVAYLIPLAQKAGNALVDSVQDWLASEANRHGRPAQSTA